MFINVNKKYDWNRLSDEDIIELIEEKIQKEIDKVVHHWEDAGIRVEKARWGRHNVIKGKVKLELVKTIDVSKMTLEEANALIEKNAPAKKTKTRKKAKWDYKPFYNEDIFSLKQQSVRLYHHFSQKPWFVYKRIERS